MALKIFRFQNVLIFMLDFAQVTSFPTTTEGWTKHSFPADCKILNTFCRYSQKHFGEGFGAIKRFFVMLYVPKSSRTTDFPEADQYVFSKMQKASQK